MRTPRLPPALDRLAGSPPLAAAGRLPPWARVLIFAVVAGAALPLYNDNYVTSVGVSVATYAILGLGLNIVVGYAGLLDLGYAAFFAIGAYTSALLMTKFGWNFFPTVPVAIAFAGTAGAILGYPTLRLRSDYLAIVTLGFGEMVRIAINNWDYAGGPNGVLNIPSPVVFGLELGSQTDFYVISIVLMAIALLFTIHLSHSRVGRGWLAIREDEFAAEAVGVPVLRLKLVAYVMGGMWAGLAGAFFASRIGAIDPTSFTFQLSVQILILIVLGGLGSLPGVLLGAFVVVGFPELFRQLDQYRLLVFAAALIVIMLVRPQGLWPHIRRKPQPFYGLGEGEAPPGALRAVPAGREAASGAMAAAAPLLEVRGLVQRFGGVTAVDDVSFEVQRGEIFSVIGPNGAGKTTVFNCLTGVQRPKRGEITFDGHRLRRISPHRIAGMGLGRTFQGIRLFRQMAVFENVMVGLYSRHRTTTVQALLHTPGERADELRSLGEARRWLRFMGIEHLAGLLAAELPYADQRRVEIARALAGGPRLVLLDEPGAGMNPTEKADLVRAITRIRDLGVTVVLIEHDMSLVMRVSDRIAVLDQGRLIALGLPQEVRSDPAVIAAYLGREEDDEDEGDEEPAAAWVGA